ncbi:GxxExxY protein [Flavobacterium sp. ALD4]|nr:GxxExxY protein [Flavobacterium sp. ALD4]
MYHNALYCELKESGFTVEAQKKIKVFYKEVKV